MRDYAHFWQWCLTVWRDPKVEKQLLELQTAHEIVILEVLMAAWLAAQGVVLNTQVLAAMRQTSERWVVGVVVPLRRQRVAWRSDPDAEACRGAIKALELQAEKVLGELLYSAVVDNLVAVRGGEVCEQRFQSSGSVNTDIFIGNLTLALAHKQSSLGGAVIANLAALLLASTQSVNSD